ncbi:MAG: diguanylate cyclase, partial [Deltaproteobacteria bacterium]|nr:diguanylate cyclase [Deltaproteobacteria bacterium]
RISDHYQNMMRDLNSALQETSNRDPLTGLLNRRALMEMIKQEVLRVSRGGSTFVVAMLDVDHFKSVNDRYGHETGDRALVELAGAADFYFTDEIKYDEQAARKFLTADVAPHLKALVESIVSVQDFSKKGLEEFLINFTQTRNIKFKIIAQPLRVALTGKTVSPGIDEVMVTLGKDRVIKKINTAITCIESRA